MEALLNSLICHVQKCQYISYMHEKQDSEKCKNCKSEKLIKIE